MFDLDLALELDLKKSSHSTSTVLHKWDFSRSLRSVRNDMGECRQITSSSRLRGIPHKDVEVDLLICLPDCASLLATGGLMRLPYSASLLAAVGLI